jgi:ubiquitin carboxyl-terminal hydrolase 22/27/51
MIPYTTLHRPSLSKKKSAQAPVSADEDPDSTIGKYTLSAVIVHKGGIDSGHYVAYAREGRDWFLFDDSKVVLASEGEVLGAQGYLLVYVCENV